MQISARADGTAIAAAGRELVSVVLNSRKWVRSKLTGLKTGDKRPSLSGYEPDGKQMDKIIAQKASKLTLMARSKKTMTEHQGCREGDLKAIHRAAGYTVKYKF